MRESLGRLGRRLLAARRTVGDPSGAGEPARPGGLASSGDPAEHDKTAPARSWPVPGLAAFAERAERAPSLDGPVNGLSRAVARALPPGTWLDDALHGVPFGQPTHPALVRLPLGCWTSAVLLDFLPAGRTHLRDTLDILGALPIPDAVTGGRHLPESPRLSGDLRLPGGGPLPAIGRLPGAGAAAQALLAIGLAAAVPSMATGLADWSALHRHQQRVGLVHAAAQGGAMTLFAASLLARLSGRQRSGKLLSLAGLATATAGAYLGGHLALRLGAGASHAESIDHLAALSWQDLCPLAELPVGRPARRQLGYLSLVALRQDGEVHVLADHCAHLGGPLHQGRVVTEKDATCIACPWHGSVFRVADGTVVHGPATARQPSFETRVTDSGWVQVRPRAPRAPDERSRG